MSKFKFPPAIVERARRTYPHDPDGAIGLLRDAELDIFGDVLNRQGKAASQQAMSDLATEMRLLEVEFRGGIPQARRKSLAVCSTYRQRRWKRSREHMLPIQSRQSVSWRVPSMKLCRRRRVSKAAGRRDRSWLN